MTKTKGEPSKTKSNEIVQKFIKKELEQILIAVNPKMDKKKFKKSIKKAGKILSRSVRHTGAANNPIEVIRVSGNSGILAKS